MRGPSDDTGPAPGKWMVSRKANGVSPGFTITDARGRRYFVKFDPPGHPELGTGAETVVTRLLHALGYYVPQVNIATLRREDLEIGPDATVGLPNGAPASDAVLGPRRAAEARAPQSRWHVPRHLQRVRPRPGARGVQVRRDAHRRPERYRAAREPARAARIARVQRARESHRRQGDQRARHGPDRERPLVRAALRARFQRRARQRRRRPARAPRRLRVSGGGPAGPEGASGIGFRRASVDDDRLSRSARHRTVRVETFRAAGVAAPRPESRVRALACRTTPSGRPARRWR